jgi:predicted dehydrogenase
MTDLPNPDDIVPLRLAEYKKLYASFEKGVNRASIEVKIGGPTLASRIPFLDEFLAWAKETYGVPCFLSAEELMDSGLVDACIIAVPHYDHTKYAIAAMEKGIHVMLEKPAGVYTKQVRQMNEAAANHPEVVFGMMFNQRTNCLYRKLRELVHSGNYGKLRRVNWIITNWYRTQDYYDSGDWRATWKGEGGGVLFNQCPHQLDLLQWTVGMMPVKMRAFCHFGKWHDIEVEDDVTAYMEFPNGATGVFVTTTADAPGTNRFEITGTKGRLVCEGGKLIFDKLEVDEREHCKTAKGFAAPECERGIEVETDGKNDQHVGIMNNFANAILGLEPQFVQGVEGINGVQLMDSMMLSTWLDKTITLPIDDDLYLEELNKRIATGRTKESVGDVVLNTEGTYGSK